MDEFAVKNFTFQDIKEAAPADRILFAYIELAEEKTAFELEDIIADSVKLGAEKIVFLCRGYVDIELVTGACRKCRELEAAPELRCAGDLVTQELAAWCSENKVAVTVECGTLSEAARAAELLKNLPARAVSFAVFPDGKKLDDFAETWSFVKSSAYRAETACFDRNGELAELDFDQWEYINELNGNGTPECLRQLVSVMISRSGEVYPCPGMAMPLGRLEDKSLEEIVLGAKYLELLRAHPKRLKTPCAECSSADVCCGCRARAYKATGDYLAADPGCFRNRGKLDLIPSLPIPSAGMLPHASRMLLIDRIVYLSETSSVHEAVVRDDNPFLNADGVLERSALPEYAAQAAALRDSVEKGGKPSPGLLSEVQKGSFYGQVRAGDLLKITVSTDFHMDIWYCIVFKIECNGSVVADGVLKLCVYDETPLPY
ncbi:MAG: SPASM domain-containing protein [Lentisphaeria bacterium]|nr:SPASM domain-containing protein [Lentisphaeria bacterium]